MGVGYLPLTLGKVLEQIDNGEIRLPNFQRDFRWEKNNIKELIVSVLNEYPIGILLFWDVKGVKEEDRLDSRLFEGVDPKRKLNEVEYLVLDGQQRLTSLYQLFYREFVVTKGGREIKFFLNLQEIQNQIKNQKKQEEKKPEEKITITEECIESYSKKEVQKEKLDQPEEQARRGLLPFNILFHPSKLEDWKRRYLKYPHTEESLEGDEFDTDFSKLIDNLNNLKSYPLYGIGLDYKNLDVVATIFEKLNTTGLPLSIFEILTAKFYRSINLRNKWEETKREYDSIKSFTKDEKDNSLAILILKAILLKKSIEKNDESLECKRKNLLKNLTAGDIKDYWDGCAKSLDMSLFILKKRYGCPSLRYLPYSTILVPFSLAVDFIENKLKSRKQQEDAYRKLERWYWASVFSERYDEATDTKSKKDINEIIAWINDNSKVPEAIRKFDVDSIDLEGATRGAKFIGVLNIIIKNNARDFFRGEPISSMLEKMRREVDVHHIIPRKRIPKEKKRLGDSILNKTLLWSKTNREYIKDYYPPEYIEMIRKEAEKSREEMVEILKEHLIPPDEFMNYRTPDDFDEFIRKRKELIIREIKRLVGPVKGST
jgi:hypothetical protein